MHPNLSIFISSFVATLAAEYIIWWMVLDKEQRLNFYDWISRVWLHIDTLTNEFSYKILKGMKK